MEASMDPGLSSHTCVASAGEVLTKAPQAVDTLVPNPTQLAAVFPSTSIGPGGLMPTQDMGFIDQCHQGKADDMGYIHLVPDNTVPVVWYILVIYYKEVVGGDIGFTPSVRPAFRVRSVISTVVMDSLHIKHK